MSCGDREACGECAGSVDVYCADCVDCGDCVESVDSVDCANNVHRRAHRVCRAAI